MIRFLEKKKFRQAIISIKALGFPALLLILLMFQPCRAHSKQAAILDAIIDGETELSPQFIENQQRELLARYFKLLNQSKIKAALASVKKSIGPETCISARCLRLMSQTLGIETLFILRMKQIDGAFQLSLLQTKNNEMHIVDDFCNPCLKEQFRLILKRMVLALVENKGNYAKHVLPLDLTFSLLKLAETEIEMPVSPTEPLSPIDAELLYPTLAMEDDSASSIPAIEIPDPEIPSSPETPRELIGLQSTEEDILIFALGKDLVQKVAGEFIFQVSAFSEIKTIEVNGEKQPSTPGIFEASIRVPYQLQPGENFFLVKVQTRLGNNAKEFVVFLETDKVKREKEKPPFQMIVISETSRDDNFLSVSQESTKTAAYKGSLTLLSTLNKRFDHQSRTALNALIMGDAYQEKTYKDYSVFFKQISWDWYENFFFFPFELKTSLGMNTVSMGDSTETSNKRDPIRKDFKQYSEDQFFSLTGTTKHSENNSWKINLERKNKTNHDDSGQNGYAFGMSVEYQIKLYDWNHKFKLVNSINDFQTDTNDYSEITLSYKFGIPFGNWKLSPLLKQTNTTYRVVNTDGVKKTSDKKNVSIELMYPLTGWMILSLTPQFEQGNSNTSAAYQKNLASLKMILIF